MKRAPLKLPFEYRDTPDLRVLDLAPDGIRCIPVLGRTHLRSFGASTTSEEHVHEECIEISFCQRGELVFDSMGKEYPFHPGMVFVSRPNESHHLRVFPKGLLMYWLFFRIPKRNSPLLSLPPKEARWLTDALLSMPYRLFQGGDRIRLAFQRVFGVYDSEPKGTPQRTLRLRLAVQDLLMAILDASAVSPEAQSESPIEQASPILYCKMEDIHVSSSQTALKVTDSAPDSVVLGVMVMVGGTLSMIETLQGTTSDSLSEVSIALKYTVAFSVTTTPVTGS